MLCNNYSIYGTRTHLAAQLAWPITHILKALHRYVNQKCGQCRFVKHGTSLTGSCLYNVEMTP